MDIVLIAAAMVALLVFPVVACGIVWLTGRTPTRKRPDPPRTNRARRTIPGNDSEN